MIYTAVDHFPCSMQVFSDEQTVLYEKAGGGHFHVKVVGQYEKQLGVWTSLDESSRCGWKSLGIYGSEMGVCLVILMSL